MAEVHSIADVVALMEANPGVALGVVVPDVNSLSDALHLYESLLRGVKLGWSCPTMARLLHVACLAVVLNNLAFDLIPTLQDDRDDIRSLFLVYRAAWSVRLLGETTFTGDALATCNSFANRVIRVSRRVLRAKRSTDWLHPQLTGLADRAMDLLSNHAVNFVS
jgi:hypothetical protein